MSYDIPHNIFPLQNIRITFFDLSTWSFDQVDEGRSWNQVDLDCPVDVAFPVESQTIHSRTCISRQVDFPSGAQRSMWKKPPRGTFAWFRIHMEGRGKGPGGEIYKFNTV